MNKERLIEVCSQIALDVENDAKEFDGKPFTGRTVAEYFGNHGAAIQALARVLTTILDVNKQTKRKETMNKPFYMVWVPGKSKPYVIHPTLEEASQEAIRIVQKQGGKALVLQAVKRVKLQEPIPPPVDIEEYVPSTPAQSL